MKGDGNGNRFVLWYVIRVFWVMDTLMAVTACGHTVLRAVVSAVEVPMMHLGIAEWLAMLGYYYSVTVWAFAVIVLSGALECIADGLR